jgi:hypothetical protein
MQHNVITILRDLLQIASHVLSETEWQGIAGIASIISIFISLLPFRKPISKRKHNLKREVPATIVSVPVTCLPEDIPLLVRGSVVSTGVNICAKTIYTKCHPLDKIIQGVGRCTRSTDHYYS